MINKNNAVTCYTFHSCHIISSVIRIAHKYSNADAESEDTGIKIDFTKKTVVIDSGHGGIDPGKKSDNGILEKDVNLSIAKKTAEKID